jgi:hypothetical protein
MVEDQTGERFGRPPTQTQEASFDFCNDRAAPSKIAPSLHQQESVNKFCGQAWRLNLKLQPLLASTRLWLENCVTAG